MKVIIEREFTYLLPAISIRHMEVAMQGSIKNVVMALKKRDADVEFSPMLDRRTVTPVRS